MTDEIDDLIRGDLATDLREKRLRAELDGQKKLAASYAKHIDRLEAALGLRDALLSAELPTIVARPASDKRRRATAVLLCSDWHVEEQVKASKVVGRNEYHPGIAAVRAAELARAFSWLVAHHRASWDIDEAVIWLGGDIISGYIHDELRETNAMSPIEATLFAQDLIDGLLAEALAIPGMRRIVVPCSYGNHGRTTHKPQVSTGAENSYEWGMYQTLRRRWAVDPRVEFVVADGEHVYLDIYRWTFRFTHGDSVRYAGGTGGITIPLNKAVARWQTIKHADVTCLGHYHQYHDLPGIVVNGSLVGYGPYGLRVAAPYEDPRQAFFLVDSEHGKVQSTPVWV